MLLKVSLQFGRCSLADIDKKSNNVILQKVFCGFACVVEGVERLEGRFSFWDALYTECVVLGM